MDAKMETVNKAWRSIRTIFDDARLTSFSKLVQDYILEHLEAAHEVLKSVRRWNSQDSMERAAAVEQQTRLFDKAAALIQGLPTTGVDPFGDVRQDYRDECCAACREIQRCVTSGFEAIFRDPALSRTEATDARSRCQAYIRCCIFALVDPSQEAEIAHKYNFWQVGHHTSRFARILRRIEADLSQVFEGFESTPVVDLTPAVTLESAPSRPSSRPSRNSGQAQAPIQPSTKELSALRERIAQLEARIRELERERDALTA
jgi:hypothetical protein